MNVSQDDLKTMPVKPGDLVVVTMPSDTPPEKRQLARQMSEWLQENLRAIHGEGICVVVVADGISIESLDEDAMRKLGWVRAS